VTNYTKLIEGLSTANNSNQRKESTIRNIPYILMDACWCRVFLCLYL